MRTPSQETSMLKSPRSPDFSNNRKETSLLKSPRTQNFSNNRRETIIYQINEKNSATADIHQHRRSVVHVPTNVQTNVQ